MKLSNLGSFVVAAVVTGTIVAGCSGSQVSPPSTGSQFLPSSSMQRGISSSLAGHSGSVLSVVNPKFITTSSQQGLKGLPAPPSERRGIYTSEFYLTSNNVLGYPLTNTTNSPPTCSESTGNAVNGLGVDRRHNLIVPNAFSGVLVYLGPTVCGPLVATILDSIDQATDAAANDAEDGTIVVGHVYGEVATCKVASLSCTQLNGPPAGPSFVAMDRHGNCYATAVDNNVPPPIYYQTALWYWASCTGTGIELGSAQGFNPGSSPGGIDVDNAGNVVVTEQGAPSTLTVYSGCGTGTCTLVAGPTALSGAGGTGTDDCAYGHLNGSNHRYACGNASAGQIDIYTYLPSRIPKYLYSFNNGLIQSDLVVAASYDPK